MIKYNDKPRVLCVEDDPVQALSLKWHLESLSAEVILAATGNEALDHLMKPETSFYPFDLIVVDMWVPKGISDETDIDARLGIKLIKSIVKNMYLLPDPSTPIVVYTAHENYPDCVECIRLGALHYIPKIDLVNPEGNKSGVNRLMDVCRTIIESKRHNGRINNSWLERNRSILLKSFTDGVCLIVSEVDATEAGIHGCLVDGKIVMKFSDYSEARLFVAGNPFLRWVDYEVERYPFKKHF